MRKRILPAIPAAMLAILGSAATAFAGGGLPVISSMQAGQAQVTIYGDSLFVHTGTNTLTVEATGVPEGAGITLKLVGADGHIVEVPLSPLRVTTGPDAHSGHGGSTESSGGHGDTAGDHQSSATDDHHAAMTAEQHSAMMTGGQHNDSHDTATAAGAENVVWFRGKAAVATTGYWKAQLEIAGAKATDEIKVVNNGPNRIYLGFTGALMGSTIIYGAIQRRRQPQIGGN